jgi:hypothetical protein
MLALGAKEITIESSNIGEMFLWYDQDTVAFRNAHIRRLEMQNAAEFVVSDSWFNKVNADKFNVLIATHTFANKMFVKNPPNGLHCVDFSVNNTNLPVVDMGSDGDGRHLNVFSSNDFIVITYGKHVFGSFGEAAEWWKHNQEMLNLLTFAVESLKEKVAELQKEAGDA